VSNTSVFIPRPLHDTTTTVFFICSSLRPATQGFFLKQPSLFRFQELFPGTKNYYLFLTSIYIRIILQLPLTHSLLRTRFFALRDHKFLLLLSLKRHANRRNNSPKLNSKHSWSFISANYVLLTITLPNF
jgi:hypothetical protein